MMLSIKRSLYILSGLLIFTSLSVQAAGGAHLMKMDVDLSDEVSLQRGARIFANYCLSCHAAEYMRYNRMGKDLGISDEILEKNFIFNNDVKTGETMQITLKDEDANRFWGVVPPDLSVIARSRGADYLYTYFKTFYLDESRPFGVNNLAMHNVGMPHVLWELQGMQALEKHESEDGKHHSPTFEDLKLVTPGMLTPEEYDQTVKDLVNFLVYMGEPIKLNRYKIGFWVMLYLIVFVIVAYMLKKEYWRDVH
jgi:ubiquinol-cytochrome c reductase cytochrome c1 subunit